MSEAVTPEVLWAQRSSSSDPAKNYVDVTVMVPDVPKSKLKLDITSTNLSFTGYSESLKKMFHVEFDFYAEVDESETKVTHTGQSLRLVLRKKDLDEEYWPRLLKEKKKVHFLKTDFEKWVDEDEQDAAPEDESLASMGGMGGMPGMGGDMASMLGMGGGGGDFSGIDFSKLGGAAPDSDDDDDDEDDDDEEEVEGKGKPKIEEVA